MQGKGEVPRLLESCTLLKNNEAQNFLGLSLFVTVSIISAVCALTCGGAVSSWLVRERSGFEPWPGTLRCVLGHDTLL